MSLGPKPAISAHSAPGCKLDARRDKHAEMQRGSQPGVPKAPRAKARANSYGALAKALSKQGGGSLDIFAAPGSASEVTKASELRKPRAEDGSFAYGRVGQLHRERHQLENQVFEMGPRRMIVAEPREDYSRSHALGKAVEGNQGVPLGVDVTRPVEQAKDPSRRRTLDHERKTADQQFEFGPAASLDADGNNAASLEPRCRGRRNVLAREDREGAFDCPLKPPVALPIGGCGAPVAGGGYHGRRSVLAREQSTGAESFPTPRGGADGFGKKNLISREMGLNGAVQLR